MFVIGLVGKTASGKGTVANILEEGLETYALSVSRVRFSDPLREFVTELKKRGINLQNSKYTLISIAEAGKIAFTPDFLAQSMIHRTENCGTDVCIWDGLRWPDQDVRALRSFKNHALIAITVGDKTRYRRFIKRNENLGDAKMSFADFKVMDSRDTEKFIPEVIECADLVLSNNEDDVSGRLLKIRKKIGKIALSTFEFHLKYG